MGPIDFWKMSGSGNDFILIDNRSGQVKDDEMGLFVERACRRRQSVGADGVIFVVKSEQHDFRWRFFNADGGEVEMCGNGGRCVARFALLNGIAGPEMTFETLAGPVAAEVKGRSVKIRMPNPTRLKKDLILKPKPGWQTVDFINTGVPHVVVRVQDLKNHPVLEQGQYLRYHTDFAPVGTNADFFMPVGSNRIKLRTYERGVEDETLACGTGAIAAALAAAGRGLVEGSPITVETRSGEDLVIHFKTQGGVFSQVDLEGQTAIIYQGRLHEEALLK